MVEGFLNIYWRCCLRKPPCVHVSFWKVCLSFFLLKTHHLKFCLDMKQQPCQGDGVDGYGPQKNSDWGCCRDADPCGVDTAARPQQSPQMVEVAPPARATLWWLRHFLHGILSSSVQFGVVSAADGQGQRPYSKVSDKLPSYTTWLEQESNRRKFQEYWSKVVLLQLAY